MRQLYDASDEEISRNFRVVGCTTAGAAKYRAMLTGCDHFAGRRGCEVLEQHVLAAMNPGVKNLIMIGDHRQLRPKVNQYEMQVNQALP